MGASTTMYDLQKSNIWKRFASFVLDMILVTIIATGVLFLCSTIFKYDSYMQKLDGYYEEYNLDKTMTEDKYNKLSKEEQTAYVERYNKFIEDKRVVKVYNTIINLSIAMVTIAIVVAFLIVEFIIPLILHDGQTVGKKVFGLCVVKNDAVKINTVTLFIRSMIGKCVIEVMIPAIIIVLIYFGGIGIIGTVILFILAIIQIILLFKSKTTSLIHDALAMTVVVDKNSQMIFDSEDDLIKFKEEAHLKSLGKE